MRRLIDTLRRLPKHIVLIGLCMLWLIPAIGLLVTSFRPYQDIGETGWWQVLAPPKGANEFAQSCAGCHGSDGRKLPEADLTKPEVVSPYSRSFALLALLKKDINGQPHMGSQPIPDANQAAAIAAYLQRISGINAPPRFTLDNYIDAIVGYRGNTTYQVDCAAHTQPTDINCNASDLLNSRGMGRALINSIIVAVPATVLPLLLSIFAAYAFAWMHFPGRGWLFVLLVGLQIVPLQMALIPILQLYSALHLNGTFLGIWLFHTGFGLPYAIFLLRNFLGALPRELLEAAHLDGASHWAVFWRVVVPLCGPALAALAIFQFLWVWNDLLVALVFLGGTTPVLTYQISNMVTSVNIGWQLLTAAAFISIIVPMFVFFALQRYFVRGLLAGSVKG